MGCSLWGYHYRKRVIDEGASLGCGLLCPADYRLIGCDGNEPGWVPFEWPLLAPYCFAIHREKRKQRRFLAPSE